jgi:hypothetical protein
MGFGTGAERGAASNGQPARDRNRLSALGAATHGWERSTRQTRNPHQRRDFADDLPKCRIQGRGLGRDVSLRREFPARVSNDDKEGISNPSFSSTDRPVYPSKSKIWFGSPTICASVPAGVATSAIPYSLMRRPPLAIVAAPWRNLGRTWRARAWATPPTSFEVPIQFSKLTEEIQDG